VDTSNLINLGIFLITALVGILAWAGARAAAREAQAEQQRATTAAARSAAAAEEATKLQARVLQIESQRHEEAAIESRRAKLRAEKQTRSHQRNQRTIHEHFLAICNDGEGEARHVHVLVNGNPIGDLVEFNHTKLPEAASIGPRSEVTFYIREGGSNYPPFRVEITWSDDSPIKGNWSGAIT
jgi:hypothetical protein